jgi:hypothetical protein
MNQLKEQLVNQARERYQNIVPCYPRTDLEDCFTIEGNWLLFWYNTEDNSTHLDYAALS